MKTLSHNKIYFKNRDKIFQDYLTIFSNENIFFIQNFALVLSSIMT